MASLNTLRTKFGALLSVIIALALLAFILSLKTDMGFSDNDPKVGVIDGDKIRYSEYLNQYDAIKNRNGGVEASTDQESDQLAAATWQALFADHVLVPGFERMGIEVPEQERLDMVSGKIPSRPSIRLSAIRVRGLTTLPPCRSSCRRPLPTPARNRRGTT